MHVRPGPDTSPFQKFQQVAVALVDPTYDVALSRLGVGEKHQASAAAAARALEFTEITMWAGSAAAQFGQQSRLKVGGDGMSQTSGFVVHPEPLHTENLGQHALDEVMAEGELARDLASGGGKSDMAVSLHSNQMVLFQPA